MELIKLTKVAVATAAVAFTLMATPADARGGPGCCKPEPTTPTTPSTPSTSSNDNETPDRDLECGYKNLELMSDGSFRAISSTPGNFHRSYPERQTVIMGVINSGPGIAPVVGKASSTNIGQLAQIFNDTPKRHLELVGSQAQPVTVAQCAMNVLGAQLSEGGYDATMSIIQVGRDGNKPLRPHN